MSKTKSICHFVLMSPQKKYVFMFLCLKLKEICLYVLMSKLKSSLPKVGRVARSAGRVFFSTPSVLASIGLVPLFYGDSLKTLVAKLKDKRTCGFKTEEHKNRFLRTKYVFMYLCQKLKSSLPRVGRVARSAGRVFFFYPLRPLKHRTRPPMLWGQLKTYV